MGSVIPLPIHDARDQPVRYLAKGGGTVVEFPRRKPACQGLQSPTNLEVLACQPVHLRREILQVLRRSEFLRWHSHDRLSDFSLCAPSVQRTGDENVLPTEAENVRPR